jgi:aryl-alcohol dehydrogenase-like predicted oxidoreductase
MHALGRTAKELGRDATRGKDAQVIKGCWQLSGGHRGDAASDRTAGSEAEQDFGAFAAAGITTFDTADHYGPSEQLIGEPWTRHSTLPYV